MIALLAEAFFGQGFFRTLIFLALSFLWGFALFDLAKNQLSGVAKVIWLLVIIFIPFAGAIVYLMTRPSFALDQNAIDRPEFVGREHEEMAIGMTHRSSG
jgi:hypothetical protein